MSVATTITGAEARTLLVEVQRKLTDAIELRQVQTNLEANLRSRLEALGRPRSGVEHMEQSQLTESIAQLRRGVNRNDGTWFQELAALAGKPGLDALDRIIEALMLERDQLQARATEWPEGVTHRTYVYTGPRFKMWIGDRTIEPGEVVELTESQAEGFRDRFEPVVKS